MDGRGKGMHSGDLGRLIRGSGRMRSQGCYNILGKDGGSGDGEKSMNSGYMVEILKKQP